MMNTLYDAQYSHGQDVAGREMILMKYTVMENTSYLICQCLDMFCSRLAVGQLGKCLSNFQATNHNIRDLAGHPDMQCYNLVHLVYKGNQPKNWFIHVYVYTWFVKPCKLLRSVPHGTCFGFHLPRLCSGRRSRSVLDALVSCSEFAIRSLIIAHPK